MERYLKISEERLIMMLDEASKWEEKTKFKKFTPKKMFNERRRIINEIYIDHTWDMAKDFDPNLPIEEQKDFDPNLPNEQ